VERNTSGSRPKELFEDFLEDMEGDYEKAKVRARGRVG
jgi:pre-mRNA-processing factor 40